MDHSYKHDQYWVGGVLPKLAQYKNTLFGRGQEFYWVGFFSFSKLFKILVLRIIVNCDKILGLLCPALYNPALLVQLLLNTSITHAHFYRPGKRRGHGEVITRRWPGYDEVVEEGHWILGRQGRTFVALYSHQPTVWSETEEFVDREVIAAGDQNLWICHVGDMEQYGSFQRFSEAVLGSRVEVSLRDTDELVQCLRGHGCLSGNLAHTLQVGTSLQNLDFRIRQHLSDYAL